MAAGSGRAAVRARADSIVEFCGLPGAGKSYVAERLVAALADRGVNARISDGGVGPDVDRFRRLSRKLRWAVRHGLAQPVASVRVSARIHSGQGDLASSLSRSVQWLVTQGLFDAASRGTGIHVFQEGVVQALWSIGLRGDTTHILGLLEDDRVPFVGPDLVVAIDASASTIRRRLGERLSHHSRTQDLHGAELEAELGRGADLLGDLLEWWAMGQGRCRVERVNNNVDGELELGLGSVVRSTESLLGGRTVRGHETR